MIIWILIGNTLYCNQLYVLMSNEINPELYSLFEEMIKRVNSLRGTKADLSNEVLLQLYGLYKQVKEGDVDVNKEPSWLNVKERAKFNARKVCLGLSRTEAMERYIDVGMNVLNGSDP